MKINLKDLNTENEDFMYKLNDLEQYGRRNSIRLYNLNVPLEVKTESDLTGYVVDFINTTILRPADFPDTSDHPSPGASGDFMFNNSEHIQPITPVDIDRCHFVGKGKGKNKKHILIKFTKYHSKKRVFMNKKNLKNNPDKIFMSEDLTTLNHNLIKILMDEKLKKNSIFGFWTRDGSIFVKGRQEDDPIRVTNRGAIMNLLRGLAGPVVPPAAPPAAPNNGLINVSV